MESPPLVASALNAFLYDDACLFCFVLQLLRQRRPFVARVTDGMGNELFRVRKCALSFLSCNVICTNINEILLG